MQSARNFEFVLARAVVVADEEVPAVASARARAAEAPSVPAATSAAAPGLPRHRLGSPSFEVMWRLGAYKILAVHLM